MNPKNLLPSEGEVYHYPHFFNEEESSFFLKQLLEEIQWKQEPIVLFGKKIMQPRLTAWYGDNGKSYRYSGVTMNPLAWTPTLLEIKQRVEAVSNSKFNSALLNQYRTGADSMGWHSDNEKELGANPVIASVSFGETRKFHLKHRTDKDLKLTLPLENGSVLVMKGETQHHWLHSISKMAAAMHSRINITFRNVL